MDCFRVSFVILVLVSIVVTGSSSNNDEELIDEEEIDERGNEVIGLTAAQIARLHGYEADIHPIDTQPGYRLNLVHLKNPALAHGKPGKNPVLFIHGIATSATCYMVNADKGRPRDLSKFDAAKLSFKELEVLLLDDPAARSLPFLLSNFGHDVWLLNRRATMESQLLAPIRGGKDRGPKKHKKLSKKINKNNLGNGSNVTIEHVRFNRDILDSSSHRNRDNLIHKPHGSLSPAFNGTFRPQSGLSWAQKQKIIMEQSIKFIMDKNLWDKAYNREYWDYSIDEQVEFDVPIVIDYILAHSNFSKVSIISHSLGGAITLMTLADKPGIAKKLGNCALLAPAGELGFTLAKNPLLQISALGMHALRLYSGPLYPSLLEPIMGNIVATACGIGFVPDMVCQSTLTAFIGKGVNQLALSPANVASFLDTTGSIEYLHAVQSVVTGKMHKFNHNPIKNKLIYGQFDPPAYDYSRIRLKSLSIWTGNTDALITPTDTKILFRRIRVPVEQRHVTGLDIEFNHMAFLFHHNVTSLFTIPLLKSLETPLAVKMRNPKNHFIDDEDFFDDTSGSR